MISSGTSATCTWNRSGSTKCTASAFACTPTETVNAVIRNLSSKDTAKRMHVAGPTNAHNDESPRRRKIDLSVIS